MDLYDGSSWRTVFDWQASSSEDDGAWHRETYALPPRYLAPGFDVRITARSNSPSEVAMVDGVSVSAGGGGEAPRPAAGIALYVTSEDRSSVERYLEDGTHAGAFVARGAGGLSSPWGLDFGPDGHLYVSDRTSSRIMRYDPSGAPAGASAGSAAWASTGPSPRGLDWDGGTLYVATDRGVERFSRTGSALGPFGDAVQSPTSPGAPRLTYAYDVAAGADGRVYVAATLPYKVLYYSASDGSYGGELSTRPSLTYARGLAWGDAGTAAAADDFLAASGDDAGGVLRIDPAGASVTSTYSSSRIDEPYGMAVAADGTIYVANKDDNNVAKIAPGGAVSALFSAGAGGLDDPRDVALGPAPPAGAGGSSGAAPEPEAPEGQGVVPNAEPDFYVSGPDGSEVRTVEVRLPSAPVVLGVHGSDEDGDEISFSLEGAPPFVTLERGADGAASIAVDPASAEPGAYVFYLSAHDGTEAESEPYAVLVDAAAPGGDGGAAP